MERTRILLAEMPRMLWDIVARVLRAQPDMEVVEAAPGLDSLMQQVDLSHPEVVIVGADDPVIARKLLSTSPRLRVLAVTGGAGDSWLYELQPQRIRLGEVSPRTLVEEIRRRRDTADWWSD